MGKVRIEYVPYLKDYMELIFALLLLLFSVGVFISLYRNINMLNTKQ